MQEHRDYLNASVSRLDLNEGTLSNRFTQHLLHTDAQYALRSPFLRTRKHQSLTTDVAKLSSRLLTANDKEKKKL